MSDTVNQDMVDELLMYIDNDGDIYRQRFLPIVKNLQKKFDKGTFDPQKSIILWMHLVDAAAKKYHKDFDYTGSSFEPFSKPTRLAVAKVMAENFIVEIESGNRW